jgi:hypothetical protein
MPARPSLAARLADPPADDRALLGRYAAHGGAAGGGGRGVCRPATAAGV